MTIGNGCVTIIVRQIDTHTRADKILNAQVKTKTLFCSVNYVCNLLTFVCLLNQDNWGSGYYLMSRYSRFYCRWFVDVTGVQSSWLSCVVALPINTDLGWSMWVHGFSLAFWLRLHPTPSPPQPPDLYSDSSQSDTWCTDTGQYFHLHRYLWLLRAYSPTIVLFFIYLLVLLVVML